MSESVQISRWETILSDLEGVYFVQLVDEGHQLSLRVRDTDSVEYQAVFQARGPYRVTDEQFLLDYWAATEAGRGWTFKVDGALWFDDIELLDQFGPYSGPYVVATNDFCLEVLAVGDPVIHRI